MTYETDANGQWLHANGTTDNAMEVEIQATATAEEYVMVNRGKPSEHGRPVYPAGQEYISFCTGGCNNGDWVRCDSAIFISFPPHFPFISPSFPR